MQFVAASKLKRAQDSTLAARPYSEKIDEVLADLAAVLGGEDHPLLAEREGGKRLIVLITTDRGLAGPLNTNTIRFAAREITERPGRPHGRHGRAQGPRRDAPRRRAARGAFRRASATGRPSPTSSRSPASSPTTSSRGKYRPGRPHLQPLRDDARPAAGARPAAADRAVRGHRGHPRQPVHLRAERRAPSSSSSCRATSRPACSRPSSRRRRARNRAGWSR